MANPPGEPGSGSRSHAKAPRRRANSHNYEKNEKHEKGIGQVGRTLRVSRDRTAKQPQLRNTQNTRKGKVLWMHRKEGGRGQEPRSSTAKAMADKTGNNREIRGLNSKPKMNWVEKRAQKRRSGQIVVQNHIPTGSLHRRAGSRGLQRQESSGCLEPARPRAGLQRNPQRLAGR